MKQSNNQVGEKVLVLGAGQLGASVLASLVPAVTQRNGSVCVIVSGRSEDKQSKRRSSIHQQLADAGARFIPVDIADSSVAALKINSTVLIRSSIVWGLSPVRVPR